MDGDMTWIAPTEKDTDDDAMTATPSLIYCQFPQ